jgi:hypothetical protein
MGKRRRYTPMPMSMPTARECMGLAVLNDKIYAVGGWRSGGDQSKVEMYDPSLING